MAEAIHSPVRFRGLRRALAISPAAAYAVRSGVAVSAAIWIGKAPGLIENHGTWILITVLVLLQPTTGGFLLKAALRATGTLVAAFAAILLFGFFAQDPPLLMAGFFLVQAVAAYGFTGPRFQYAWYVGAFTTAIVLGDAMAGRGPVETIAFPSTLNDSAFGIANAPDDLVGPVHPVGNFALPDTGYYGARSAPA